MIIYLAYRNSDTTEGRGPMVVDKAFLWREHAENYIDDKPGVMGRKAKWSQEPYGDWTIKEMEVLEYDFQEHERIKQQKIDLALTKLTYEERILLGLVK